MRVNRKNDLSLKLFEVFGAVIVHQTTVDAAIDLGISQPAVSIAIKKLEKQLGFCLFERRNQRLQPTTEARSLFAQIEPVLLQLRSVESHVRDLREGTAGNLRIMATPPLGHSIIPPALQNFLLARPEVLVHYDVRRMENVIKELETGSAELGLVLGVGSHPAVNVRTLHSELMVALVHPAHPLASSVQVTPEDCLIHGHIGLDHLSRLGVLLRLAFEERGVPYLPRVTVRYCHTSAMLANAKVGVAIVDRYTADLMMEQGMIILPFRPRILVGACLLTRKDATLSRIAQAFVQSVEVTLSNRVHMRLGSAS